MEILPPPPLPPQISAALRCPGCGHKVMVQLDAEGPWPALRCCPCCGAVLLLTQSEEQRPCGLIAELLESGDKADCQVSGGCRCQSG